MRVDATATAERKVTVPAIIAVICCIVLPIAVVAVIGVTSMFDNSKKSVAQSGGVTLRRIWNSISGVRR